MTRLLPAIGSGYHPAAWCHECGDPYPADDFCLCVLDADARKQIAQFVDELLAKASIRRRTLALLAERYGPKCSDCGEPARSRICASCLERLL